MRKFCFFDYDLDSGLNLTRYQEASVEKLQVVHRTPALCSSTIGELKQLSRNNAHVSCVLCSSLHYILGISQLCVTTEDRLYYHLKLSDVWSFGIT